jgi:hypothetical protein
MLIRRLEAGDLDGSVRRALQAFDDQVLVESILEK